MKVRTLTLSAMFLGLAFVMPFLTGQIPQVGSKLCPMHIPVILCGFFCGAPYGCLVGFLAPLLRSAMLGMPPMFPVAVAMAFELAAYGWISGWLYKKLPKGMCGVYTSLIGAMLGGRLVWGMVMFWCLGGNFGIGTFLSGAITTAIPGIVLQLVIIPILVMQLGKVVSR